MPRMDDARPPAGREHRADDTQAPERRAGDPQPREPLVRSPRSRSPRSRARRSAWVEPTTRLRLRWGGYRERLVGGAVLIVGGLVHLQSATSTHLWPLLVGTAAHAIGWWILPAVGWRRIVVVLPSCIVVWLLLAGPQVVGALAVPYVAWLLVRSRPLRSYASLVPVVAAGVVCARIFRDYSGTLAALGIMAATIAVSAWLARWIHRAGSSRSLGESSALVP